MPSGWFNGEREYYATAAISIALFPGEYHGMASAEGTAAEPAGDQTPLTALELEICHKVGVSPEDFIEAKSEIASLFIGKA